MTEIRTECIVCKRTEREVALHKCPVCMRYFCDSHRHIMAGREFCGERCAKYFFFPDDDES